MHAIRTTPGFILETRPYGEAGKVIALFTRDFGLVLATAQGIRLEKSKLRYHVQDQSFGSYSLVRGKEFWRLTNAQADGSEGQRAAAARELLARIAALMRRLLHGEEPHPELFDILTGCRDFAAAADELGAEQLKTLESVTVLRIMHALGYVRSEPAFAACLQAPQISAALLADMALQRPAINQYINRALRESHL